jgi:NAD(P)-dependent dehydrogenase (short-subunit alcohol dehydrogenase family)
VFDLSGHVALITGGNGGIGLGMARGIAKSGGAVAIWGRNLEKNQAAVAELHALGARAEAFPCDVSRESEIVRAMDETLMRFGRVDSCFANAGMGVSKAFTEMSLADWNAVLDVNLTGVFLCFREAVRHMIARGGGGKLVATSSIGALHGMPKQPNYAATKAGVIALVRSLAVELGKHDIQANALVPGWIETEMTAPAMRWKKLNDTIVSRTPAGRWGTAEDMEGIAAYLASPESRFHTGDVIRLDGGYAVF